MIWPTNKLTRFEVARLLGARSLQVALGAPILLKSNQLKSDEMDCINIAKAEFKEKIIPMTIKRKLPDGGESTVDIKEAIDNWLIEHKGEI
jgi:DNA-directed RNA polymerase subunit K